MSVVYYKHLSPATQSRMNMSKEWYQKHKKENIDKYLKLLSFPSISTNPEHEGDVRACAEWLYEQLVNTYI